MTQSEALLTAARHYLTDNFNYWAQRYAGEKSGHNNPYSDNDYNLFPRYNVILAILQNVEELVGRQFDSIEDCKQELKKIALQSESPFTKVNNDIEKNAFYEERNKFSSFIGDISEQELDTVTPLPYKRKLREDEAKNIRNKLFELWQYDGSCWYPLSATTPVNTIFLMNELVTDDDNQKILNFIAGISDKKNFQISEGRIDYEVGAELLTLDPYETITFDRTFKWVIYGSHESTLSFGGISLVEFIQELFKERKESINKWEQNW